MLFLDVTPLDVTTLLNQCRLHKTKKHSPGWAPDSLMVGIRSPDGLVVGLAPATLEFWVRFPNERNQEKQGATLCYSTGFLTGPTTRTALSKVLQ